MNLTSIELTCTSVHSRPCITAADDTHRYHIWLKDDFTPQDETVYKNPIGETRLARTIYLQNYRGIGRQLANLMLPIVTPENIAAYKAQRVALAQKEDAERKARIEQNYAEKAGPQLLAALKAWHLFMVNNYDPKDCPDLWFPTVDAVAAATPPAFVPSPEAIAS